MSPIAVGFATVELDNSLAGHMACGIEEACRQRGWVLQVCNAQSRPDIEAKNLEQLRQSGTRGAIVLPVADHANLEALFKLKLAGFPFVLLDRSIPGLRVDVVESDHETGGYLAVRHLLERGHRRVFMLTCPHQPLISSAVSRLRGYERAMLEFGIDPPPHWRIHVNAESESRGVASGRPWLAGYEAALAALGQHQPPLAFFALNAHIGRGLLEACRELHLRVGQDVSIVCFDDTEFMQAFDPPITVVAQRAYEIGRAAIERLEQRIQTGTAADPRHVRIDIDLIQRQSVATSGAKAPS